jgi:hypothetical protein
MGGSSLTLAGGRKFSDPGVLAVLSTMVTGPWRSWRFVFLHRAGRAGFHLPIGTRFFACAPSHDCVAFSQNEVHCGSSTPKGP